MITDVNYYKKVGKRILIVIITLIGLYIAFKLSIFYIPFLIAFTISLLIEPLIKKIMKITNLTRKASAIITLIIVFSIIIVLLLYGIVSLISETTTILENLNNNMDKVEDKISNLIYNLNFDNINIPEQIKSIVQNGANNLIGGGTNIVQNILTKLISMITNIPKIMICVGITIIATYFVCTDKMYILDQIEHHLPRNWVNKFGTKLRKVIKSLGEFLKAEGILILISFSIVLIGLISLNIIGMNVRYPLVIAILIGFIDALPILGAGTIMVPWSIVSAFNGDINLAICLTGLYIIVIVVRQIVEPKVISSHIGIHPIFTLIAMYTGFKIVGIFGMFVGPIVLIILKSVFETMIDNGVIKTILDRK